MVFFMVFDIGYAFGMQTEYLDLMQQHLRFMKHIPKTSLDQLYKDSMVSFLS
jgi:hypothetical protein